MNGIAKASMLNLKPRKATIHELRVDPRLVPMITAMALPVPMNPAPLKARTSRLITELLCTRAVVRAPVAMDFSRVSVARLMALRSAACESLLIPVSSRSIPSRKRPKPANSPKMSSCDKINTLKITNYYFCSTALQKWKKKSPAGRLCG